MTSGSTNIEILHPNHCMHTLQNYVDISGVKTDIPTVKLQTNMGNTQFTVATALNISDGTFIPTQINNAPISDLNLGYVLIDSEIVVYSAVNGNTITVPSGGRGISNTVIVAHNNSSAVEVYSLNGVPLTQINKRHKLTKIVDMDRYQISVASNANTTLQTGGSAINATRNFQFESITPRINDVVLSGTSLNYKISTVAGSNVTQQSTGTFAPVGSTSVSNLEINELDSSRVILSEPNQTEYFGSPHLSH